MPLDYWNEGYKQQEERYREAGIDYDLTACLKYNTQEGFDADDIIKVLAVHAGQNDGDDWRWVLELTGGRLVFLQGGCDYTGWDCQSWATHVVVATPEEACEKALGDIPYSHDNGPHTAGLGHMLNILGGTYTDNFSAVRDELLAQVHRGKTKTWHEETGEQLGNPTIYIPRDAL